MTSQRSLTKQLLDVVQAYESVTCTPYEDFADAAFRVLALALSTLPPEQRENRLQRIEDFGALRQAVAEFPERFAPYPRANGHARH